MSAQPAQHPEGSAPPPVRPARHPVRLVVTDDLRRSRLTVFFRALIAIPHFLWAALIGSAVAVVVFINWWATLITGRSPKGLHDFTAGFVRYATHIQAYVLLAANPFPSFYPFGDDRYPIDLEIDPPVRQNRWKTLFRIVLALPAMFISGALLWGGPRSGSYFSVGFGLAFLLWFVTLARGRAPRGLRDLLAYCIGYAAQLGCYLFLLTDRYPYSGPNAFASAREDETPHPVRMTVTDDLRRSRLLVLFRLPIAVPHIVWYLLWTVVALVVALLTWVSALVIGRPPQPFHRFLGAYVRYSTHLYAFVYLVGNPFPGFVGQPDSYPVDLQIDAPGPQKRLVTLFRVLLAIPALMITGSLYNALGVVGILGWFVSLFRSRMPDGMRNLGAYTLRYGGQTWAYLFLLTARYPDSGPRPDPAHP